MTDPAVSMPQAQTARAVMMVRPARFEGNSQTADSNAFQARDVIAAAAEVHVQALREFEELAHALMRAGVEVCVFDDTPEPHKPDAIFPNNWVSFHADGTAVLYPMLAENRRLERSTVLLERLVARGFRIRRTIDLTAHENSQQYLEGTGSLVLDHVNRLGFAGLSPRTHLDVLGDFAQQLDYEIVSFDAVDAAGVPIYHTNVLMCVGPRFAVICGETIRDEERRAAVRRILSDTGHELIEISLEQMNGFAGNMLALQSQAGTELIALSANAWSVLDGGQRARLERHGQIVAAPIPTIERYGGGSVRCMLAEIHLPRRAG